jgi:hypothetical protein
VGAVLLFLAFPVSRGKGTGQQQQGTAPVSLVLAQKNNISTTIAGELELSHL